MASRYIQMRQSTQLPTHHLEKKKTQTHFVVLWSFSEIAKGPPVRRNWIKLPDTFSLRGGHPNLYIYTRFAFECKSQAQIHDSVRSACASVTRVVAFYCISWVSPPPPFGYLLAAGENHTIALGVMAFCTLRFICNFFLCQSHSHELRCYRNAF